MTDGIRSSSIWRISREERTGPIMWRHCAFRSTQTAGSEGSISRIDCTRRTSCPLSSSCFYPFRSTNRSDTEGYSEMNIDKEIATTCAPITIHIPYHEGEVQKNHIRNQNAIHYDYPFPQHSCNELFDLLIYTFVLLWRGRSSE